MPPIFALQAFRIPDVSLEKQNELPIDLLDNVISNECFALYDASLWNVVHVASPSRHMRTVFTC